MPLPTALHVDTFLTNAAAGYHNSNFIARDVLPTIPIMKETGQIAAYGTDHYRIDNITPRAFSGRAARVDWSTGTPVTFSAKEWTLEHPVDDRLIDYADDPFQPLVDGTWVVNDKLSLKLEDLVATLMATTGNFGANAAAAVAWGTSATATPVKDIRTGLAAIVAKSGMSPVNIYAVMDYSLWNKMVQTTEFKTLYLSTIPGAAAPGNITPEQAAAAIGLAGIYVGYAVKLTSNEGATDAFSSVWSSTVVALFARNPRVSLQSPSWGALLGVTKFGATSVAFDRYREEQIKSTIVRGTTMYDQIAINKNYGYAITGC
jgi:hypothetical protein